MHQDIKKLINAAKEKGSITEQERDSIIQRAEQLHCDMAEVDLVLSKIPVMVEANMPTEESEVPTTATAGPQCLNKFNWGAFLHCFNLKIVIMKKERTRFFDRELTANICMWELCAVAGFIVMLLTGGFSSVIHSIVSFLALIGIFAVVGVIFHLIGWMGENHSSAYLKSDDLDNFLYY